MINVVKIFVVYLQPSLIGERSNEVSGTSAGKRSSVWG